MPSGVTVYSSIHFCFEPVLLMKLIDCSTTIIVVPFCTGSVPGTVVADGTLLLHNPGGLPA
jgi:hypothetical protein